MGATVGCACGDTGERGCQLLSVQVSLTTLCVVSRRICVFHTLLCLMLCLQTLAKIKILL